MVFTPRRVIFGSPESDAYEPDKEEFADLLDDILRRLGLVGGGGINGVKNYTNGRFVIGSDEVGVAHYAFGTAEATFDLNGLAPGRPVLVGCDYNTGAGSSSTVPNGVLLDISVGKHWRNITPRDASLVSNTTIKLFGGNWAWVMARNVSEYHLLPAYARPSFVETNTGVTVLQANRGMLRRGALGVYDGWVNRSLANGDTEIFFSGGFHATGAHVNGMPDFTGTETVVDAVVPIGNAGVALAWSHKANNAGSVVINAGAAQLCRVHFSNLKQ